MSRSLAATMLMMMASTAQHGCSVRRKTVSMTLGDKTRESENQRSPPPCWIIGHCLLFITTGSFAQEIKRVGLFLLLIGTLFVHSLFLDTDPVSISGLSIKHDQPTLARTTVGRSTAVPPALLTPPVALGKAALERSYADLESSCATIHRHPQNLANHTTTMSVEFLEWTDGGFVSLHQGSFHFFHFLEFLVVAFTELNLLNSTNAVTQVDVPYMEASQICGSHNCLLAKLVFGPNIVIRGLPASVLSRSRGASTMKRRQSLWNTKKHDTVVPEQVSATSVNRANFLETTTDYVLSIQRPGCVAKGTNIRKMWSQHIDSFPVDAWHQRVAQYIKSPLLTHSPPNVRKVIRVGYIDRQNTQRRLPGSFHRWIVSYMKQVERKSSFLFPGCKIEFYHLHMEKLSPDEQIRISAPLDILIGVHGNGLSHMFFMKPRGAVLELFWEFRFHFDYATAAQMMRHEYLAIYNGIPMDAERIANRDGSLIDEFNQKHVFRWYDVNKINARVRIGVDAAASFVQSAIARIAAS